jgi:MFS transporter, ACS family, hexuronate transporter
MRRFRWFIVAMLFLANVINYLDRSALSVAAPLVRRDLGLSPADLGFIFSAFFVGYALFNFVGGVLADRAGGKTVFGWAMGLWSFLCALTAAATGFASLFVIRVAFGMAEGPLATCTNKMINNWFPHRQAGSAIGYAFSGSPLGGAVAGPIVGLLAVAFGWKISFVIVGALGLVWLALWATQVTEGPDGNPRVSEEERREVAESRPPLTEADHSGSGPGLGWYIRQPVVLATTFAFFGYNYVLYFFLTWFPSYLTMARHLSIKSMSIATVLPWLLGFIGLALGGRITDLVLHRTGRPLFARKILLVSCLGLCAICVALTGLVTTVGMAVGLVAIAVFFLYLTGSTYWAIIQDSVRGANVGGTGGFMHGVANCSGIIGPSVTGLIVQASGGFGGAFALAGGIAMLGAIGVAIFVRPLPAPPLVPLSA